MISSTVWFTADIIQYPEKLRGPSHLTFTQTFFPNVYWIGKLLPEGWIRRVQLRWRWYRYSASGSVRNLRVTASRNSVNALDNTELLSSSEDTFKLVALVPDFTAQTPVLGGPLELSIRPPLRNFRPISRCGFRGLLSERPGGGVASKTNRQAFTLTG